MRLVREEWATVPAAEHSEVSPVDRLVAVAVILSNRDRLGGGEGEVTFARAVGRDACGADERPAVVVRGAGEELHGVGLVGAAVYGALHDATEEGTSNRFWNQSNKYRI